ncbi:MAG: Gfo/Idh/MocA family oxidoreductase [Pirellulales bacterium]|nr:Gfo/Idh/MocA family oxidoreductase [Pirellulales bacterium]
MSVVARGDEAKPLRAGIIGLDTSHVIAFTKVLNRDEQTPEFAGVRVVAAYPGGSQDVESSHTRVEGYTREMKEMGVQIVDSIDQLLKLVDVVLLESVDGRPHLKQAEPVIQAGKPLFIDKPAAGSLADVIAIFRLAAEHKVPCFSSSSLRFSPGILGMRDNEEVGDVLGCAVYSPCHLEPHHPDLFWYGVHGVEMLFTIMGTGCESVVRTHADGADVVTGVWKGGRIGSYRGLRDGAADYGGVVFGSKKIAPTGSYAGYEPLVAEIVKFFKTGNPPVSADETIEIFAFMEAADESKRQGGKPVTIASVLEKAGQK